MALNKSDNQVKELSAIAVQWLAALGVKANKAYTKDAITTHPDYPAITAITDFLESGGMAYNAVQADASYIHEFNYPLLAHIKQPGNEYLHIINNANQWDIDKDVTQYWSGIVLFADKNVTWHNEENNVAEKQAQKSKLIATAFVIAGLALFLGSIFVYSNAIINIFGFLSLAGLVFSIAALGTELGYQSKIVKQVCGTVGNGGCEKVLSSKFAKGFGGVTPADASVLYFATQFIMYIAGCYYQPLQSANIAIAFTGIVVAIWSIYTQAVKLKEWCALCLCIAAVLLIQFTIAATQFNNLVLQNYLPFAYFAITFGLLLLAYLAIKQLIKTNSQNKQELSAFKKWKTDASLFVTQWEKEPTCDNSIWENDLLIGKADAPIRITVACNPYCGPCAKAHKELDELLDKHPNRISLQIRLLCSPSNKVDDITIAVEAILKHAETITNVKELQVILSNWFEWMDYDKWRTKWKTDTTINVENSLIKHENWNKEAGITHTPTIFVNSRRLPGRYGLKDLEKMLPQLQDTFTVV
jgi:uncharacterized membrane protein/thiol-disulfide isomerase/thioredoxin